APLAASLPVTTTAWAPALAAARAMAEPMPWVEPVTTTTRPFTLSPPLGRSYYPYAISDQRFRLSNSGTFEARRTYSDLAIPRRRRRQGWAREKRGKERATHDRPIPCVAVLQNRFDPFAANNIQQHESGAGRM